MAYSNTQVNKRKKEVIDKMADTINTLELTFMEPDDRFNKSAAAFNAGRLEELFIELGELFDFFPEKRVRRKKVVDPKRA